MKYLFTLIIFIAPILLSTATAQQKTGDHQRIETPAADKKLSGKEAVGLTASMFDDHLRQQRENLRQQWNARQLTYGDLNMKFDYTVFGDVPANGRSLFISMHGGGNTSQQMNDRQWDNQKKLYTPKEGVYLAPRAPTNTWNLWHEPHIDTFFARIILGAILFEKVDPNRVYLMGYSAGGDGVYQLAPRMADRFAAAAMMAGHPNETSPLGLRNIGFTLHMGGVDSAYDRNKIAARWAVMLDSLATADPGGYRHLVKIHEGKPHWMSRLDTVAVDWMAAFQRNPLPSKIVWKQDDVNHHNFYWLAVPPGSAKTSAEIVAEYSGNNVRILRNDSDTLLIRLNDKMMNLNKPVKVLVNGKRVFKGKLQRTKAMIEKTIAEKSDPELIFSTELILVNGKVVASDARN